MGIDGYLRRADAATISLIRQQAGESDWTRLKEFLDENIEWQEQMLLNKEAVEDENEEDDAPDEQYFPIAFYDWVLPKVTAEPNVIPKRFESDESELFMRRVSAFAFLKLFPYPNERGLTLAVSLKLWKDSGRKDGSLLTGCMADDNPKILADELIALGLLDSAGREDTEADPAAEGAPFLDTRLRLSQKGHELIQAVVLRSDTSFFWNEDWPTENDGDGGSGGEEADDVASVPGEASTTENAHPSLLTLPLNARAWILTRLDCPSLCRFEMLSKAARSMIFRSDPQAPPAPRTASKSPTSAIDARVLTPIGLLAWFVVHRRAWGRVYCTKTLLTVGYRKDAIRRHLRRRAVNKQLYSAGGLRLRDLWHAIHYCAGPVAGKLILTDDAANTKFEMGGSGIPVVASTPEEVATAYAALRERCCADAVCLCGHWGYVHPWDSEFTKRVAPQGAGGAGARADRGPCPFHTEWDGISMWEFADKMRRAGVMGPRDLDDADIGWVVSHEVLNFLRATVENGQGLVAYVW